MKRRSKIGGQHPKPQRPDASKLKHRSAANATRGPIPLLVIKSKSFGLPANWTRPGSSRLPRQKCFAPSASLSSNYNPSCKALQRARQSSVARTVL